MTNLTKHAKSMLKEMAHDLYIVRAEDIEIDEIANHYFNLGWLVRKIEKYTTFDDIIRDVRCGEFETLGFFKDDEHQPAVETFIHALYEYMNSPLG